MTVVKICGISRPEHAIVAAEAGADYIGLVFAPSRRRVGPEAARDIVAVLRSSFPDAPQVVGVFVDAPLHEVRQIKEFCSLDVCQLHGRENWEYVTALASPIFKAIRVPLGFRLSKGIEDLEGEMIRADEHGVRCLLDSHVEHSLGGSGQAFDWSVARELGKRHAFLLAGGLTPENVGQAIDMVNPWGVDVTSGVESRGVKDPDKIVAFVRQAKRARVADG